MDNIAPEVLSALPPTVLVAVLIFRDWLKSKQSPVVPCSEKVCAVVEAQTREAVATRAELTAVRNGVDELVKATRDQSLAIAGLVGRFGK